MTDFSKELVNYAIIRLDGAWFRYVMQKYGVEEAVDIDADVWRDWTMRITWKIKKSLGIPRDLYYSDIEPIFHVLQKIAKTSGDLMGFEGKVTLEDDKIHSQIRNCQYWESIKKAGFDQFTEAGILCSKVHVAGYEGMLKGVFPNMEFELKHTKSIPAGDDCCAIEIIPISKSDKLGEN